jgi:glycosyltransferase involved in cell wall biosynthesis
MIATRRTEADEEPNGGRKPLRLLFLSSDKFPPFRVDVSVMLGEEFVRRGHRIDWILQSATACDTPRKDTWAGGVVTVGATDLGGSRRARVNKHVRDIHNDCAVFRELNTNSYDAVVVKDKFVSALFAYTAARRAGVPFIYWVSFPFPEESSYRARSGTARYPLIYWVRGRVLHWLLYKVLVRVANLVFVQSERMKADFVKQGAADEKLVPLPMGVPRRFVERPKRERPAGSAHVVYLGTLNRTRRLDFVVRAFALVRSRFPNARLSFVGAGDDPEDEAWLRDSCAKAAVERAVEITGLLARDDALDRVADADVCVSPFVPIPILLSTFPTKLVEYLALGKPVVANDHPEQRRILEESGGGLCVPYAESAFADAICTLLCDRKLAERMGERGREYVRKNLVYDRIVTTFENGVRDVGGGARAATAVAPPAVGDRQG